MGTSVHASGPRPRATTKFPCQLSVARLTCLVLVLATALLLSADAAVAGEPAWTTYHHDAQRTGGDPDAVSPLTPSLSWESPDLGAPIWVSP